MGALQPVNIFLRQEIDRMQKVISTVRQTLSDLLLAIDGTIIMSENLRDALDNIYDARVPSFWRKVSSGRFIFEQLLVVYAQNLSSQFFGFFATDLSLWQFSLVSGNCKSFPAQTILNRFFFNNSGYNITYRLLFLFWIEKLVCSCQSCHRPRAFPYLNTLHLETISIIKQIIILCTKIVRRKLFIWQNIVFFPNKEYEFNNPIYLSIYLRPFLQTQNDVLIKGLNFDAVQGLTLLLCTHALDFLGIDFARILVHRVDRAKPTVFNVVVPGKTELFLDDRILQSSSMYYGFCVTIRRVTDYFCITFFFWYISWQSWKLKQKHDFRSDFVRVVLVTMCIGV